MDGSTSHGDDEDEYERLIEDPYERSARGDESEDAAKAIETLETLGVTVWRAPPEAGAPYETVTVNPDFSDAALKQAVVHLRKLPNWHALSLNFSRVTDSGLIHLKELPQVQKLSLKVSKVTDAGLKRLAEMSWLREIDLTPWGRYLGIYRLEDDTLTLCLSPVYNGRRTRPTRFSPEAFYGWMYVFQRVKE
ncbi:MAG TPA: hypothetical protein VFW87_11945 [Pirellulales bacterium]|nr:hypothetical protein [Pirellulales bacterium]